MMSGIPPLRKLNVSNPDYVTEDGKRIGIVTAAIAVDIDTGDVLMACPLTGSENRLLRLACRNSGKLLGIDEMIEALSTGKPKPIYIASN